MRPSLPTPAMLASAFDTGSPVRAGGPVVVRGPHGYWVRDLAGALRGDPQPWHQVAESAVGVVMLAGPGYRAVRLGARSASPADASLLLEADEEAPLDSERHDADADGARHRAGALLMRITDVHLRAEALDAYDAWSGAVGTRIDASADGELHAAADAQVRARILLVRCPSTGRRYAHLVPPEMATAAEARRWMMGLAADAPAPEVET